ncbi:MAG: hypothetical protein ABSF28_07630 [Terracidiphilus sp.]|jgi:hypothetical protein
MRLLSAYAWEVAVGSAVLVGLIALGLWLKFRKRPTPEELERARRLFLSQSGRMVDGMLLDICEIEALVKSSSKLKDEPARMLTMLMYSYHIGGVDYECAQDITSLLGVLDVKQIRAGFPCSARYQPGNPQNSIVVSEEWSGLRMGLPVPHVYEDPDPIDMSHLRPGRG